MNILLTSLKMFLWMTFVTGIIYPLLITGIAQLSMKNKADGSMVINKDQIAGSRLIAQKFVSDRYFWPRPSAVDYNPLPSGGSNLGPTSDALKKAVEERRKAYTKDQKIDPKKIPNELLFASGSGLDPHISIEAAYFQIGRIAQARKLGEDSIKKLIDEHIEKRYFGFIGETYVNVFLLNAELDKSSQ